MCFLTLSSSNISNISNINNENSDESKKPDKSGKIGNVLGLARRAGAICAGTEIVVESVRKGRACHVYISSDASVNTVKKLYDKTAFYSVPVTRLDLTMDELAHCVGFLRPTAAVSLINKSFLKLMENCLKNSDNAT